MKLHAIDGVLATWDGLNAEIMRFGEADCVQLIDAEKVGRNRKSFILRLHSRLNKVRAARERVELLKSLR